MGQIFFNTNDGSYYIINNFNGDVTFDGNVKVDNIPLSVTNLSPDKAVIIYDPVEKWNLIIRYNKSKGETWNDMVGKYALSSDDTFMKIVLTAGNNPKDTNTDLEVLVSNTDEVKTVTYSDESDVEPDNKIGKKGSTDYTDSYITKDDSAPIAPIG